MNLRRSACLVLLLIALALVWLPVCAASTSSYTYDVTPDGLVKVTIHPVGLSKVVIPPTAENLQAKNVSYTPDLNWELFKNELTLRNIGNEAKITYDWPDGGLPWPTEHSDWMQGSEYKWCTDSFMTAGPAEVTIILPKGAEVEDYKDPKVPYKTVTGPDGRVRVVYTLPSDFKAASIGLIYKYPWANKYTFYGKSPLPCYYPTVLGKHPEFMTKLEAFYKANEEFYYNYKQRMGYAPPHDIGLYVISWVHGYGGAYTAGNGTYYNYRRMPAFEWPPIKFGGNLMGAYHEMSHAFQPICAPDFFGGHVWSAYWTMDYDYNSFPDPVEVAKRKAAGIVREDRLNRAYALYQKMREQKVVPGLWYKWSNDINNFPGMEAFVRGHDEMQELACAYVLNELDKELGTSFYGKYFKMCVERKASVDVGEPMQQKMVAWLMSQAAGKDLTPMLEKLTGCDLKIDLSESSDNLLQNNGMETDAGWQLEAWQSDAKMSFDSEVSHSGKRSLKLYCPTPNDAHIDQVVKLKPKTNYLLTGWIKTEKVGNGESGVYLAAFPDRGSNIITGTTDWQKMKASVYSGDTGEVRIGVRLGYWGQVTAGTVWIDDIELVPVYSDKGWNELIAN